MQVIEQLPDIEQRLRALARSAVNGDMATEPRTPERAVFADNVSLLLEAADEIKELRIAAGRKALAEVQAKPVYFAATGDRFDGLPTYTQHDEVPQAGYYKTLYRAAPEPQADIDKFRQHSIALNRVLWRMLEALGDVRPDDAEHFSDMDETIERFFAARAPEPQAQGAPTEPVIAIVTTSHDYGATIDWRLNPLPAGTELYAAPRPAQAEAVAPANMGRETRMAIMLAYGHLWHINNEPAAPTLFYDSEKAAYAARRQLRDLLTTQERGEAINQVGALLGKYVSVTDDHLRITRPPSQPAQAAEQFSATIEAQVCPECEGPLQWRCPVCRIAQSEGVAEPAQAAQLLCPKCGTDRFKAACPQGHSAALTGHCPMVGTAAAAQRQEPAQAADDGVPITYAETQQARDIVLEVMGKDIVSGDRKVVNSDRRWVYEKLSEVIGLLAGTHLEHQAPPTQRQDAGGDARDGEPLRRGVSGVCERAVCICERDGLGDQCIWLKPKDLRAAINAKLAAILQHEQDMKRLMTEIRAIGPIPHTPDVADAARALGDGGKPC